MSTVRVLIPQYRYLSLPDSSARGFQKSGIPRWVVLMIRMLYRDANGNPRVGNPKKIVGS